MRPELGFIKMKAIPFHLIPAQVICQNKDDMGRVRVSQNRVLLSTFAPLPYFLLVGDGEDEEDEQPQDFLFHVSQMNLVSRIDLARRACGLRLRLSGQKCAKGGLNFCRTKSLIADREQMRGQ